MSIEKNQTAVIPTNDYVFKRIFGKVGNEFITKEFLSVILDRKLMSVNLEGNTILEKELLDDKLGILDIKAKEELDKIKRDEYEERIAELRMKHILDSNSLKAECFEDGFEAGKIEGKVEGKIEGMLKERNDIAIEMIKNGYSIDEISKILKLSELEIKRLSHKKI